MRAEKTLAGLILFSLLLIAPASAQTGAGSQVSGDKTIGNKEKSNPTAKADSGMVDDITTKKSAKPSIPEIELTNARIEFDHTEFDFGCIPPGARVTHSFPVKNVGPDTLEIVRLAAG
jgi:hypothetical protein